MQVLMLRQLLSTKKAAVLVLPFVALCSEKVPPDHLKRIYAVPVSCSLSLHCALRRCHHTPRNNTPQQYCTAAILFQLARIKPQFQ